MLLVAAHTCHKVKLLKQEEDKLNQSTVGVSASIKTCTTKSNKLRKLADYVFCGYLLTV